MDKFICGLCKDTKDQSELSFVFVSKKTKLYVCTGCLQKIKLKLKDKKYFFIQQIILKTLTQFLDKDYSSIDKLFDEFI